MIQGAQYGTYSSNYIAQFWEYPNGIAVVDSIAATNHPDWERKTEKRAEILTEELSGMKCTVCIKDVFVGKDTFEGVIQ